jgi:hypothetical protein
MSESDQFRQYAEEAMLWLAHSKPPMRSNSCLSCCAHGREQLGPAD